MIFFTPKRLKWQLLCLLFISIGLFVPANTILANDSIHLYIDTSEGGTVSNFRLQSLKKYLRLKQCSIDEISYGNKIADGSKFEFIFTALQPSLPKQFVKIADLKIIHNEKLSGSIIVRGATGINNIANLAGVHIAFLSPESITGYQLQQNLFKAALINHSEDKITFTQTNLAAISLLLHKDVFAAAIATPLAKKWAETNDLIIVATSKEVKTGGLWVQQGVSSDIIDNCAKAFVQITKAEAGNQKLLRLFPAWLDSFTL